MLNVEHEENLVSEELRVKRLWSIRSAAVILLLAVSAMPAHAQGVTLRYRWIKGEALTYRMSIRTTSTISGVPGAGDMSIDQTMTQTVRIAAQDVAPDGTATLRQTFESVRMEMTGPMGKVVYDSTTPARDPNPMTDAMAKVMGALVGESVGVVITSDGTVKSVEGASGIVDKITQGMAADPAAAGMVEGLKTMLSDDSLKTTMSQSFSRLPAAAVRAGDTWSGQLAMGNPAIGRIAGTTTFTLKAIEGQTGAPLARIAVTLELRQEVTPRPSGPARLVVKLGDSKGEGEIVFDVGRGCINRSSMRTDIPSTMTMMGSDGSPATMQNKTTTTMMMELVEK
jgi:hypothetical protein